MPTNEEILVEIRAMKGTLNDIKKSLYGNGRPGLSDRTTILEQSIIKLVTDHAECPAREAFSGGAKRQSQSNTIAMCALAVSLAAVLIMVVA